MKNELVRRVMMGLVVLVVGGCQGGGGIDALLKPGDLGSETQAGTGAVTQPKGDGRSSLLVYIKLVTERKFGGMAHVAGKRDVTIRHTEYGAAKPWWDNPLVVFDDGGLKGKTLKAGADGEEMKGKGASSNVAVAVSMVPHADVAVLGEGDALRGTLTVTVSTVGAYYDGRWTEMVRVKDKVLTFKFDTVDGKRAVEEVGRETRVLPAFGFERYTREHEKWEERGKWPRTAVGGDWWTVVYGKGVKLEVVRYRYKGGS